MTLLVGDNSTQTGSSFVNNDTLYIRSTATAVATGTATTAWIRVSDEGASTSFKICVYNGTTGALLATSASITAAAGWVSGSISLAISSGTKYTLGVISTGGSGFNPYVDGTAWNIDADGSGTYASPPSSTTVFDDGNGGFNVGNISIYLDGTTGGSPQTVSPSAISDGAIGTQQLNLSAPMTGISSSEVFGSLGLSGAVGPSAIAPSEAFGTAQLNRTLPVTGLDSIEAFGATVVAVGGQIVSASAIASLEAFGTAKLNATLIATALASGEAFGTDVITPGNFQLTVTLGDPGDPSVIGYYIGFDTVSHSGTTSILDYATVVDLTGGLTYTFTNLRPDVIYYINATTHGAGGHDTYESLPLGEVSSRATMVLSLVGGIASSEAFGVATLNIGPTIVSVAGLASAGAFGTPAAQPGVVTISPTGLPSSEVIGTITLTPGGITVSPTFAGSGEAFGTLVVQSALSTIEPFGIASAEALGTLLSLAGNIFIQPNGLNSLEGLGQPQLNRTAPMSGITSAEVFGSLFLQSGGILVVADPIISNEAFGTAILTLINQVISPGSITQGDNVIITLME